MSPGSCLAWDMASRKQRHEVPYWLRLVVGCVQQTGRVKEWVVLGCAMQIAYLKADDSNKVVGDGGGGQKNVVVVVVVGCWGCRFWT